VRCQPPLKRLRRIVCPGEVRGRCGTVRRCAPHPRRHLQPSSATPTDKEAARAAVFDAMFAKIAAGPLVHDLHRRAYGVEHPEDIEVFSSCTRGTLDRALAALSLPLGGTLVDLGCGLGGPGRWLARASGTRLVGIDFSRVALDAANKAANGYLKPGQYEYRQGTFAATGLPDACADGAVSIDALPMASDRGAALVELCRILRPGARAVLTCTEWHSSEATPYPRLSTRWAPLIAEAGLTMLDSHSDYRVRERLLGLYELWVSHEVELRAELGDTVAEGFLTEARDVSKVLGPGYVSLQITVERSMQ
jgi:SAM-dependent methyltransferase